MVLNMEIQSLKRKNNPKFTLFEGFVPYLSGCPPHKHHTPHRVNHYPVQNTLENKPLALFVYIIP